jgi:hypothetical protein
MGFLDTITLSNKTLSILFYVTFFIFIIPAYILAIMLATKKNEETHKVSLFTGSGDRAIIQSSATEQELYVFKVQNTPVDGSSNFTGSFNMTLATVDGSVPNISFTVKDEIGNFITSPTQTVAATGNNTSVAFKVTNRRPEFIILYTTTPSELQELIALDIILNTKESILS